MKTLHNDVVLGTSVALLAALGCWKAAGFSEAARVFPLLVLAPAVPLGILIAIRGQMRLIRDRENPSFFLSPGRFFLVAGITALALVGLRYLGFLTTSAIAIPTLSYLLGYRRPWPVLATTATFVTVIYIVFVKILSQPLPREIWTRFGG